MNSANSLVHETPPREQKLLSAEIGDLAIQFELHRQVAPTNEFEMSGPLNEQPTTPSPDAKQSNDVTSHDQRPVATCVAISHSIKRCPHNESNLTIETLIDSLSIQLSPKQTNQYETVHHLPRSPRSGRRCWNEQDIITNCVAASSAHAESDTSSNSRNACSDSCSRNLSADSCA